MPQQLANLALPSRRPDIQPRTREIKNANPRPNNKPDTFTRTLDRQLDKKQAAKQAAQNQADRSLKSTSGTSASKDKAAGSDNPKTTEAQASNDVATTETNKAEKTSTEDTAHNADTVQNKDAAPAEGIAITPALIITSATLSSKAVSPALTITGQPGSNGAPETLPGKEILPETPPKETTTAAGKSTDQKPAATTQSPDLFTKELSAINAETGSKVISDEAKARLDKLSANTKDHKNPVGLLQKALSSLPNAQNSPQNGLVKIAPNATANANATANVNTNANFTLGTDTSDPSAEISQNIENLSITPQNAHAVSTKFGTAIQSNQSAQTAINSLAVQVARNVDLGINRFQIRMDPPELGRIDVKLKFSHDGRVTANMTVERPETLDLLMRDARTLERALAGSGLNTDSNSLNFSLKDQSANEYANFNQDTGQNSDPSTTPDEDRDITSPINKTIAAYRNLISSTAIDIRI